MLEALHPGRIDLGIGRRARHRPRHRGRAAAVALHALGAEDFPLHLLDLMGLLGDVRTDTGLWSQFAATPVSTSTPWIGLLGSSGYSAELAGYLGLPFSFAHHFDMGTLATTVQAFELLPQRVPPLPRARRALRDRLGERAHRRRRATRPTGSRRRAASCCSLAAPAGSSRCRPPDIAAAHPSMDEARALPSNRIVGTPADAVEQARGARLAHARRRGDGEHGHLRHRGTSHAASSCSRTPGSREWQSAQHGSRERSASGAACSAGAIRAKPPRRRPSSRPLGFGALWIPGGAGGDVLGDSLRLMDATTHVVVATGILNIWMHEAADVAAGHAALTEQHPGRFLLGLGVSHAPPVERSNQSYTRPFSKMVDFLDQLDAASPAVPHDEMALAALGPKMLRLSAERTAGAHPYFVPPEHTAIARAALGDGPAARDRADGRARDRCGNRPRHRSHEHRSVSRPAELHEQPALARLHRR